MDKSWVDLIPETEMIQWQRHLHRHPESSFHEEKLVPILLKRSNLLETSRLNSRRRLVC